MLPRWYINRLGYDINALDRLSGRLVSSIDEISSITETSVADIRRMADNLDEVVTLLRRIRRYAKEE